MTRKWFQIHFSTAVIVILIAGALLVLDFGPWLTYLAWIAVAVDGLPILIGIAAAQTLIVIMTAVVCEFFIRHREANKP
jgi:hypothetical protein